MTKLPLLIFAFLFQITAYGQVSKNRPQDPKTLGELVFQSFQSENYSEFEKYLFTEADCDTMAKNANASDSLKIVVVEQMKGLVNRIRQSSKENFQKTLEIGKQNGVVWKKAVLKDIKFEIQNRDNIQSSDIFLFCSYNDTIFSIKLDNCHKSDAWLMMDKVAIRFRK